MSEVNGIAEPAPAHQCDMCGTETDQLEPVSGVGLICAECFQREFEPSEQPLQGWW